MLWIAPRKPGANRSSENKKRTARLEAAALVADPGRLAVEHARADGTSMALDGVKARDIPPDLGAARDARPSARASWNAFPRSVRRGASIS